MTNQPLDPKIIMAAHQPGTVHWCSGGEHGETTCLPYLLAAELAERIEVNRSNSQSARRLMDAIRSHPAFPADDVPLLFGDRALLVINSLNAQIQEVKNLLNSDIVRVTSNPRTVISWITAYLNNEEQILANNDLQERAERAHQGEGLITRPFGRRDRSDYCPGDMGTGVPHIPECSEYDDEPQPNEGPEPDWSNEGPEPDWSNGVHP